MNNPRSTLSGQHRRSSFDTNAGKKWQGSATGLSAGYGNGRGTGQAKPSIVPPKPVSLPSLRNTPTISPTIAATGDTKKEEAKPIVAAPLPSKSSWAIRKPTFTAIPSITSLDTPPKMNSASTVEKKELNLTELTLTDTTSWLDEDEMDYSKLPSFQFAVPGNLPPMSAPVIPNNPSSYSHQRPTRLGHPQRSQSFAATAPIVHANMPAGYHRIGEPAPKIAEEPKSSWREAHHPPQQRMLWSEGPDRQNHPSQRSTSSFTKTRSPSHQRGSSIETDETRTSAGSVKSAGEPRIISLESPSKADQDTRWRIHPSAETSKGSEKKHFEARIPEKRREEPSSLNEPNYGSISIIRQNRSPAPPNSEGPKVAANAQPLETHADLGRPAIRQFKSAAARLGSSQPVVKDDKDSIPPPTSLVNVSSSGEIPSASTASDIPPAQHSPTKIVFKLRKGQPPARIKDDDNAMPRNTLSPLKQTEFGSHATTRGRSRQRRNRSDHQKGQVDA